VDLSPVSVPEPSALALVGLGIGAGGWAALRRRSPRRGGGVSKDGQVTR